MQKLLKKIILALSVSVFFFSQSLAFFPKPVHAQYWYKQTYREWFGKVYDTSNPGEIFGERYTAAQVQWVLFSLISLFIPEKVAECQALNDLKACFDLINAAFQAGQGGSSNLLFSQGPILTMAGMTDILLTKQPVSGIDYIADVGRNLKIVPEAKAQEGFGFRSLAPALVLWRAVRNITYALLTIVIVGLAFMIMFRVKISPQVVITAQSALPKIVIALILITFSYAIAGLLVDLMHLVFGLIALFLTTSGISSASIPQILTMFFEQTAAGMLLMYSLMFVVIAVIGGLAGFGIGSIGLPLVGTAAGTVAGALIPGLIAILLFILTVRVFWLLLKTYVIILLQVVLAPIQILLGTLTGAVGFGTWLREFLANLAVFPTVGFMLVVAHIFFWGSIRVLLSSVDPLDILNWGFLNPFHINPVIGGQADFPLLGTAAVPGFEIIGVFVSFAVLFLIPSAGNMIRSALAGKPFEYGTAIGEAVGLPVSAGRYGAAAGTGLVGERITRGLSARQRGFVDPLIQQLQKMIAGGR